MKEEIKKVTMENLKNKTLKEIEVILTDVILTMNNVSNSMFSPYDMRCRMSEELERFLDIKNSNNREGKHYFEFYFEPYYYIFSLLLEKEDIHKKNESYKIYKPKGVKFKEMSISTETGNSSNRENISCSFEYDEKINKFILLPYDEGSNKINENSWLFYSKFYIKDKKTPIMNFMNKNFVKENLYKNLDPECLDIGFLNYRFKEYNGTIFNKEELFSLYKDFLFEYHLKNTHYLSNFFN
jgi:hypothetical protein